MFDKAGLLGFYCETSVHAGSGSDLGVVDMPIQREKHTSHPIFRGSTVKGSIRESFSARQGLINHLEESSYCKVSNNVTDEEIIDSVFGKEGADFASAISFTDAKALLFPVKTVKGTFAWITSKAIISRLKRDLENTNITLDIDFEGLDVSDNYAFVNSNSEVLVKDQRDKTGKNKLILEEYYFEAEEKDIVDGLARWISDYLFPNESSYDFWDKKLNTSLVVLNDEDFKDFVKHSTEINARTSIDSENKVVEEGGLWYEESVPSDTIFYSLVLASKILSPNNKFEENMKSAENVLSLFNSGLNDRIQLGGNKTIGQGIIRTSFITEDKEVGENNGTT